MSSLAGDPKAFSMALIIGFFIINTFNRYSIFFFKYDILLKYFFLFTAFSTLSTSGIVLFAILFFLDFFYRIAKSKRSIKLNSKKILYSFMVIIIIGFLLLQYWGFISSIIELRVFGRDIVHEDFDAPIQIFLSKFPEYLLFGAGLGNIHNLAYPYIASEHMHYMENSIFVAKSGYLRIISELGLIGFSLFILMTYSVYKKLSIIKKLFIKDKKNIISSMQLLLFLVMIAYFSRSYVFGEYIMFLAMVNVIGYSKTVRRDGVEN